MKERTIYILHRVKGKNLYFCRASEDEKGWTYLQEDRVGNNSGKLHVSDDLIDREMSLNLEEGFQELRAEETMALYTNDDSEIPANLSDQIQKKLVDTGNFDEKGSIQVSDGLLCFPVYREKAAIKTIETFLKENEIENIRVKRSAKPTKTNSLPKLDLGSTCPWDNDMAADWFGFLFDETELDVKVRSSLEKGIASDTVDEIRAAASVLCLLGRTYVWPIEDLDDDIDLASLKLEQIKDRVSSKQEKKVLQSEIDLLSALKETSTTKEELAATLKVWKHWMQGE